MTEEELIEIEARCNAATPGPWEQVKKSVRIAGLGDLPHAPNAYGGGICNCLGAQRLYRDDQVDRPAVANAVFIAASRSDVPALVAEVRRLRAELARREDLKAWIDDARERGE
jgi:hypothetical protein